MPGRIYADDVTVDPQNVVTPSVTVRPSIAANNPALGLYQTWGAAHAAIAAVQAPKKIIYIDDPAAPVVIGAGAFDMSGIAIVGLPQAQTVLARQRLTTSVGTTFTGWTEGCEGCNLNHMGVVALATYANALPNAIRIRTGKNALWQSDGNAAPIVLLSGTGGLYIDVEEGTQFVADGAAQYELVELTAGEIEMRFYDNVTLSVNWLRGGVGLTVNQLFVGIGPTETTNANFLGTIANFIGSSNLQYTPGTPAIWTNPDPLNIKSAVDRIASALAPLLGGGVIP